ncbi:MAG: hypothetical protein EA369_00830 [Bradymonadales bacterium]|nr:MAG: hypothetical protein EA369_00830 [Bradymonadales bacterium]
MLRWLEKNFGALAIPQLTKHLVFAQGVLFVFVLLLEAWGIFSQMYLIPSRILGGEYWRILTWVFIPPAPSPTAFSVIVNFFALYLFYIYGSALEEAWSRFRFNFYLILGFVLTFLASWISPQSVTHNYIPLVSVFFAFAILHPDFELRLFLLIPVKIKWLAIFTAILLGASILSTPLPESLIPLIGLGNFFLFFWRSTWDLIRWRVRRSQYQKSQRLSELENVVSCEVCKKSSLSDPDLDFRFCSRCDGARAFCPEHLLEHEHIVVEKSNSR